MTISFWPMLARPVSVLVLSLLPALPCTGQAPVPSFVAAAKKVVPSVVTVRTWVREDPPADRTRSAPTTNEPHGWVAATTGERDYPGFRPHANSSGFVVTAGGEVLTTLRAIRVGEDANADVIEVETFDGQRALAEVLGVEPTLQLAVLRCAVFTSANKPDLRPVTFGDSDAVEIGSWVVGVGDPPGPERVLATGLLAAKPARDCYQELMSSTFMQASMAVPVGALGGPLMDIEGNVLGILTTLDPSTPPAAGVTWALPAKIIANLHEAIRAAGTVRSPWLGFSVMSRAEIAATRGFEVFQKMQKPGHGILLENVFAPSPAVTAGLLPGDFLVRFAGVEIHQPVDFQRQLYLAGVGREVEIEVFREGKTFAKTLRIEARPPEAKPR